MPSRISRLGLATLLYLPLDASGATIHRCQAPDGRITFTTMSCAIDESLTFAGMSQQEVESALGKRDKISIGNSSTRYHYQTKRGRSASIEFDERGCTKGKAKSQTAKSPL
ncbi:hypothetical protein [Pseudomonas sp. NPDC087336]|uniref:hypothetical protein n=1 Tax=Pseudomonas sp. NPDC087336 TaxID=3364436 RepID=UPI00381D87AF